MGTMSGGASLSPCNKYELSMQETNRDESTEAGKEFSTSRQVTQVKNCR